MNNTELKRAEASFAANKGSTRPSSSFGPSSSSSSISRPSWRESSSSDSEISISDIVLGKRGGLLGRVEEEGEEAAGKGGRKVDVVELEVEEEGGWCEGGGSKTVRVEVEEIE